MAPDVSRAASGGRRRIHVIFNPAAGGNRRPRLNAVLAHLKDLADVTVIETKARGHAEEIARAATTATMDVIVAAGGDGTVNEIINGLTDSKIALGLIPLGTANVLADEIGLPRDPARIAKALAAGPVKPIHMGRANNRRFTMMAGAGFDANVVNGVSLALKKKIGPLAYVWQTVKQAFKGVAPPLHVVIDGVTRETASVVVCNGRFYGGPFVAAPNASIAKDDLHAVLLKGAGWIAVAKYGAGLVLGFLPKLADVEIVPARSIVVTGGPNEPVQADGDIITHLPATISVDPMPIGLVHPA